ncbi:MAG TPA: alkaline phosphatase family protein [Egibacteraceae bacterium]|nr:alkaline phosphatase family protein [Egibacteraceae bacterium]
MNPVRPDYDGAWVGGIVPALLEKAGGPWLPAPVADAACVVLLVLDGLGWDSLVAHRPRLPSLSAMAGGPITTAAPSTTAAGLTSITTGAPPAQHGITGYRMRVGGDVLNVLGWTVSGNGKAPDPEQVQPRAAFLGRRVPVVTRAEFRGTGFTAAHLRGAEFVGWRTAATLVEHVRRLVAAGARLVYAYYEGVDKVAHAYGLNDEFFAGELSAADRLVTDLLDVLPRDCALLVTSDHGQVHVGPDGQRKLTELDPMIALYSGEGRLRSLHSRAGAAGELAAAATERFGHLAWVMTRAQLFDEGWLGPGSTATVRGRVGDVVLAAREPVAFIDPAQPGEAKLIAAHGSLTRQEMLVPLLAARGRADRSRA